MDTPNKRAINSLAVSAPLTLGALYSVLQRFVAQGLIVGQGTIVAPVGDVQPPVGRTIRATLDSVTLV